MQAYSESERKALSAFSMVKNGIGAGLDVGDLVNMVGPVLTDETVKGFFDSFMREDVVTYEAIADLDLADWQTRRADFVAAQLKVDLAAQELTSARQLLDELKTTLPTSVQWTANGFVKREFARQDTQGKRGAKTKARDESGSFQGKEPGHIYVPCKFRILASAALKEHNARGIMRLLGSDNGRWIVTASISLLNGEILEIERIDADPRKALDWAYTELAQVLLERDIMTTDELGFLVYPGSTDPVKRHKTTLTNRPRDVLGSDGYKKDCDYVELVGEDKYV